MKKSPYILKDLSILKMKGFPRGMKSLNNLAKNVNIISGANASGKSSSARAIQELVWHTDKNLHARGVVKIEEDTWGVEVDFGRVNIERNGVEDELKGLPAKEGHHRYMLALHNFVEGDERDLAKEIAKQSIGGFDLDATYEQLRYTSKVSNKSNKEYRYVEETDQKVREVLEQQRKLKREEEGLSNLKSKEEKARKAYQSNEFYTRAADYIEAKLEYRQLTDQMQKFPSAFKKLTGQELVQIEEYESQIEESENRIAKAQEEIEKSREVLNELTILKEGIGDETIEEIELRKEELSSLDRKIVVLEESLTKEKVNEEAALKSIDPSIQPDEWKGLQLDDVSGLDKMLRQAHQVLGEKQFILSEIKGLEERVKIFNQEHHSSETLNYGIRILSEWLKKPLFSEGVSLKQVVSILAFGVVSLLITFYFGVWGLGFGLLFFIISFFYLKAGSEKEPNLLSVREDDFNKSGLTPPSQWDTQSVIDRLEGLIINLKEVEEGAAIKKRVEEAKFKLQHSQNRMDEIEWMRKKWMNKLQAAPGFPQIYTNDFTSLYWFLDQVKKWQMANNQRVVLEESLKWTKEKYEIELNKINSLFTAANIKVAEDVISANASLRKVKTEEEIRKSNSLIIIQKSELIEDQLRLKKRGEEKLADIYKTLDIAKDDKASVQEMISQLEVYNKISKEHHAGHALFIKQESVLQAHSLYAELLQEIDHLTIDEAKEKANNNKEIADGLEEIQRKITEIETLIQSKKRGHELENLLADKQKALEELQQVYENNLSAIAGDLIVSELKKETHNKNRPGVFKLADKIFRKITLGRYQLLLDDKGESSFRAFDTITNRGYNLSELSTGTRVQLLLAIRLAYVDSIESSLKLPLLADELLANSDDERAQAIIDALIEISREGRQVFYFTAQADEVAKWQSYLSHSELDFKMFNLQRDENEMHHFTPVDVSLNTITFSSNIPKPAGASHLQYSEMLSVPYFNIMTQSVLNLHLWFVIDDVEVLYNCLKKGIKTWGQLDNYYEVGVVESITDLLYEQIKNRTALLMQFQKAYRIGRSKPIDREVLLQSNLITSVFINRVSERLIEVNNDPKLLVESLRNGDIPRFLQRIADQLEDFLIAEGYIDDRPILGIGDILRQMHAFISTHSISEEDAEQVIKRVLEARDVS